MKKFLILALALFTIVGTADAQRKKGSKKNKGAQTTAQAPQGPKKESFTKPSDGLFGVSRKGKDWYFIVPDSVLNQPILAVTRYIATPVGAGVYGGEEVNEQTVYWEQGVDSTLILRSWVIGAMSKEGDRISQAVQNAHENPVIASCKIEGRVGQGSRVKVTQMFEEETPAFSMPQRSKRQYNLGNPARGASFIKDIKTFPINTEVKVTRTYTYQQREGAPSAQGPRTTNLMAGMSTGMVSVQLNTSFVLLPKVPMARRMADPRVGYFTDGYDWFTDDQQQVKTEQFITRWRLEARPEDVEKQKRGELVEPIKPIVYYIDPATPKQWVPYLIAGVSDWQKAFEQAGWKNAIHAEEWPNDSTMSLEDARYSVIRYLASDIPNAYGPNVHDPRTGEILESHIGWYHNVMQLVHDWYLVQAGAIDSRAQKMKFSDELMGDLIRFVSSHEVGHTLGLRHNMGASSATPVEKLRDKAWVEANGHTASIMDYARFNYVAQPEDNISKAGIYPRINDYDKWAIEFGYRPQYDAKTEKEDHEIWNKIIIDRLAKNPRLWFGGEGRNHDPRAQTEDLGDNNMTASTYGVKNLKRIIKNLPEWTTEEANMYTNLKQVYESLLGQYQRYLRHVATNIGGLEQTLKSVEQPGDVYTFTKKARQKEALAWLDENVFQEPAWLVAEPYMSKLTLRPQEYLFQQADYVIRQTPLLRLQTLTDMQLFSDRDAANYKPEDYLNDLYNMVFKELDSSAKVTTYRRHLQRAYINALLAEVNNTRNANVDSRSLAIAHLNRIQGKAKIAGRDAVTKAHWSDLAKVIENGLNPKK